MAQSRIASERSDAQPLLCIVQEQIGARLRKALELADGDLSARLGEFREVLSDVLARAETWDVVRTLDPVPAQRLCSARLSYAVLGTAQNEPLSEWLLIPFGEVAVERPIAGGSFVFTPRHAESAKSWFERMGRKLAIDYEHQSVGVGARADGLRPAAGWIGGLRIGDDGLWAVDVTWTDRAKELLRSGEYRYFSPVIYWSDEDYTDVVALGPVALTNDPAMQGVTALAASTESGGFCAADAAGAGNNSTDEAGRDRLDVRDYVPRIELEAAEAEIAILRRQLALQDADTFVERGMRAGKILDSTSMDWREDYLRNPEQAAQRLARAPVLLPPGRVLRLNRRREVEELLLRGAGESAVGRCVGIEAEDLAAFERALAAGRVQIAGLAR